MYVINFIIALLILLDSPSLPKTLSKISLYCWSVSTSSRTVWPLSARPSPPLPLCAAILVRLSYTMIIDTVWTKVM